VTEQKEGRRKQMNVQQATSDTQAFADAYQSTGEAASREEHFDEHLLLAQAKAGRSAAFGQLCERHRPKILGTAFRTLRNREDAEDAVQRAFQRAFTNLRRFRGDSAFSTWLTRITINEALMMLRRRRADQRLFESEANDDVQSPVLLLPDKGPTPEEALAQNELRGALTQAISQLRKNLRTVVVLGEFQGLTSAEIASCLGLSVATVKARIFHARRRLRRCLRQRLQTARNGLPLRKSNKEMGRCVSGAIA
jgi:RNA polymerase sigma-70 factor (ECF subfamily)